MSSRAKAAAWAALSLSLLSLASGQTSCMYFFDDGAVDLSALGTQNYLMQAQSYYSVYFRPCNTLSYDDIMPEGNAYCSDSSYACQLNTNVPSSLVGDEISGSTDGVTTTVHIAGGSYCPKVDKYRQLTIKFTCGPDIGAPVYDTENNCHYYALWQSSAACPLAIAPETPFPPEEASDPIGTAFDVLIRRAEYSFWLADSPVESFIVNFLTRDSETVLNMHRSMSCTPRPEDDFYLCSGELLGGDGNIVVSIDDVAAMQVYAKLDGSSEVYLTGDVDFLPTTNTLLASMTNALLAIVRAETGSLQILVEHAKDHMVLYMATNSSTSAFLEIKDYALQSSEEPLPTSEPDGLSQGAIAGIVIAGVILVTGVIAAVSVLLVQKCRRDLYKQLDQGESAITQRDQGESAPSQQVEGSSSPAQRGLDESTPIRAEQGETYQATTNTVPADS